MVLGSILGSARLPCCVVSYPKVQGGIGHIHVRSPTLVTQEAASSLKPPHPPQLEGTHEGQTLPEGLDLSFLWGRVKTPFPHLIIYTGHFLQ